MNGPGAFRLKSATFLALSVIPIVLAETSCKLRADQFNALSSLYNDLNGSNWIWNNVITPGNVWNFSTDPCLDAWQGITCNCNESSSIDGTGAVLVGLNLSSHNLRGLLNSECINTFANLTIFAIRNNSVSGSLISFAHLDDLMFLDLSLNDLTGSIPQEMFQASHSLISFDLSNNCLSGSLPLTVFHLSTLILFTVEYNKFTGSIPNEISGWKNITSIDVGFNSLAGSIPTALGLLSSLKFFAGRSNQFSGQIPTAIVHCTNLVTLRLDINRLSGSIPTIISLLPALEILTLTDNQLEGPISQIINASTQTRLATFDVHTNKLTGTIPSDIFLIPSLRTFSIFLNCFSGSFPSSICGATNLHILAADGLTSGSSCRKLLAPSLSTAYKSKNQIQGTVHQCLFELENLTLLHMSGAGISGNLGDVRIPSNSKLTSVTLSNNKIVGTISQSMLEFPFPNLDLSSNRITGTIEGMNVSAAAQAQGGQQSKSLALALSVNRLSGRIPPTLRTAYSHGTIDILSGNVFTCVSDSLPLHDPDRGAYTCGSELLDISVYVFAAIVSCVAIYFLVVKYRTKSDNIKSNDSAVFAGSKHFNNSSPANPAAGVEMELQMMPLPLPPADAWHSSMNSAVVNSKPVVMNPIALSSPPCDMSSAKSILDPSLSSSKECDPTLKARGGEQDQHGTEGAEGTKWTATPAEGRDAVDERLSDAPAVIKLNDNFHSVGFGFGFNDGVEVGKGEEVAASSTSAAWMMNFTSSSDGGDIASPRIRSRRWIRGSRVCVEVLAAIAWFRRQSTTLDEYFQAAIGTIVGEADNEFFRLLDPQLTKENGFPKLSHFFTSLSLLRAMTLSFLLLYVLMVLPLFIGFNFQFENFGSTLTFRYQWSLTAAFLTGTPPAALLLVVWMLLATMLQVVVKMVTLDADKNVRMGSLARDDCATGPLIGDQQMCANASRLKFCFVCAALIVGNIVLMFGADLIYILTETAQLSVFIKYAVQATVGCSKAAWNIFGVENILLVVAEVGNGSNNSAMSGLYLGLIIFNVVVAPSIAVLVASSSCFYYAFQQKPPIPVSYSFDVCHYKVILASKGTGNQSVSNSYQSVCFDNEHQTFLTYFPPPFVYSYQCGASIITNFVPLYAYAYSFLILTDPCLSLMLISMDSNKIPRWILRRLSGYHWPFTHQANFEHTIRPNKEIKMQMINIIYLSTFGMMSLQLVVMICIFSIFKSLVAQVLIVRYYRTRLSAARSSPMGEWPVGEWPVGEWPVGELPVGGSPVAAMSPTGPRIKAEGMDMEMTVGPKMEDFHSTSAVGDIDHRAGRETQSEVASGDAEHRALKSALEGACSSAWADPLQGAPIVIFISACFFALILFDVAVGCGGDAVDGTWVLVAGVISGAAIYTCLR